MMREAVAVCREIFGWAPRVGGIGETNVIRPEDRPHDRMPASVDLPPAAGVGGELGGAPDANARAGLELRMLMMRNLEHDKFDHCGPQN